MNIREWFRDEFHVGHILGAIFYAFLTCLTLYAIILIVILIINPEWSGTFD